MKRIRILPTLTLAAVWVMLMGRINAPNVVFGLVLAVVVLWLFPMPPTLSTLRLRPRGLVVLLARFFYDLVVASFAVALLALRPKPIGPGSVVGVPLRLGDDLRRTVVAELTSLVPGTVVIDLNQRSSVLTLHVLDITDRELLDSEIAKVHALEDRVERALALAPGSTPMKENAS